MASDRMRATTAKPMPERKTRAKRGRLAETCIFPERVTSAEEPFGLEEEESGETEAAEHIQDIHFYFGFFKNLGNKYYVTWVSSQLKPRVAIPGQRLY